MPRFIYFCIVLPPSKYFQFDKTRVSQRCFQFSKDLSAAGFCVALNSLVFNRSETLSFRDNFINGKMKEYCDEGYLANTVAGSLGCSLPISNVVLTGIIIGMKFPLIIYKSDRFLQIDSQNSRKKPE